MPEEQPSEKDRTPIIKEKVRKTEELPKSVRKKQCLKEMDDWLALGPNILIENRNYLAKKYDFDWHTINKWAFRKIEGLPESNVSLLGKMALMAISKALDDLERIKRSPDIKPEIKVSAISALNQTIKTQIEVLEAYGKKEPTPIKQEIEFGGFYGDLIEAGKRAKAKHSAVNGDKGDKGNN